MPVQCTCPACGTSFTAHASAIKDGRRFCSRACGYANMASARTDATRFWAKVNKDGPTLRPEIGSCWVWTGARIGDGYGYLNSKRRGAVLTHRYAWKLTHGEIPDDMNVLHRCDNPPCVRPEHLFLGTQSVNIADMWGKGRAKQNPRRGESHPFARLSEKDVRAIRNLRVSGLSIGQIATQLRCSKSSVQGVLEGKTWVHVR